MTKFQLSIWLGLSAITGLLFANWASEGQFYRGIIALIIGLPFCLGICYVASIWVSRMAELVKKRRSGTGFKSGAVRAYAEMIASLGIGGMLTAPLIAALKQDEPAMIALTLIFAIIGIYVAKEGISEMIRFHSINRRMRFPRV